MAFAKRTQKSNPEDLLSHMRYDYIGSVGPDAKNMLTIDSTHLHNIRKKGSSPSKYCFLNHNSD